MEILVNSSRLITGKDPRKLESYDLPAQTVRMADRITIDLEDGTYLIVKDRDGIFQHGSK
jgi:hypothetical protein